MPEVLVEAESVTAGHDQVPAVRDLSFTLRAGEITALLGPNGAGKTTTMLSLVGLLPLLGGSVTALGRPVGSRPTHDVARDGVQIVPDDRGLFPGLTVGEHFRLVRHRRDPDLEAEVLERFPALEGLRGRRAGLLSGGEQQMVAIARALLAAPRALMIDEMSLGLAPQLVRELLPAIGRLARERGIGVLLIEQHIDLALSIADHAIILSSGAVAMQGSAAELLRRRDDVEDAYFGGGVRAE